jgi:diacylglycerol kinase (ATP)
MMTTNPHKGRTGLARIRHAAGYSMDGMVSAYRGESAFRQETWLAVVLVPLAFWVGQTWIEAALLAGSVVMVMVVELLNSAVEAAIDRISFELHPLAKRAKDYGSAAVFLALAVTGAIWAAALWHRFIA